MTEMAGDDIRHDEAGAPGGDVRAAARAHAYDQYLAALLAPGPYRADLIALAAYLGELARIPFTVSEPMLGEIRLQWWRDALESAQSGARSGNPIADEIADVMKRRDLPLATVLAPVEGHMRALVADGIADEDQFRTYLAETDGAALGLAARILGEHGPGIEQLCAAGGAAIGQTRVAMTLPLYLSKGYLPLPATRTLGNDPRLLPRAEAEAAAVALTQELKSGARSALAEARAVVSELGVPVSPAFLPLALVAPYLRALDRPDHDPLLDLAMISPLTRVFRILWTKLSGRF